MENNNKYIGSSDLDFYLDCAFNECSFLICFFLISQNEKNIKKK